MSPAKIHRPQSEQSLIINKGFPPIVLKLVSSNLQKLISFVQDGLESLPAEDLSHEELGELDQVAQSLAGLQVLATYIKLVEDSGIYKDNLEDTLLDNNVVRAMFRYMSGMTSIDYSTDEGESDEENQEHN